MFEMVDQPGCGRVFAGQRRVRLGDCSPGGRLRLDAVARYLQDFSDDDTRDAGLDQATWVVRRTVMDVLQFPGYLEPLEMITWCSGIGSRWAERRIDIASPGGGSIRTATLWVHVDGAGRPAARPARFDAIFEPSTSGRTVSSRLTLSARPTELIGTPWPVRFSDFDVMGHVNNAAALVVVEEALSERRELRAPLRVEVEYREAIERGDALRRCGRDEQHCHHGWLVDQRERCKVGFTIGPLALLRH